jgi:hypothetical protein
VLGGSGERRARRDARREAEGAADGARSRRRGRDGCWRRGRRDENCVVVERDALDLDRTCLLWAGALGQGALLLMLVRVALLLPLPAARGAGLLGCWAAAGPLLPPCPSGFNLILPAPEARSALDEICGRSSLPPGATCC